MPTKYGKTAQKKVKRAMHEYKEGDLKIGKSNKKVKSRKQAIAIGLSEAREKGAKVPEERTGSRSKNSSRKSSSKNQGKKGR